MPFLGILLLLATFADGACPEEYYHDGDSQRYQNRLGNDLLNAAEYMLGKVNRLMTYFSHMNGRIHIHIIFVSAFKVFFEFMAG